MFLVVKGNNILDPGLVDSWINLSTIVRLSWINLSEKVAVDKNLGISIPVLELSSSALVTCSLFWLGSLVSCTDSWLSSWIDSLSDSKTNCGTSKSQFSLITSSIILRLALVKTRTICCWISVIIDLNSLE